MWSRPDDLAQSSCRAEIEEGVEKIPADVEPSTSRHDGHQTCAPATRRSKDGDADECAVVLVGTESDIDALGRGLIESGEALVGNAQLDRGDLRP